MIVRVCNWTKIGFESVVEGGKMTRRCSHCNSNGHNTRTCATGSGGDVMLFGVRLTDGAFMKKSASMGNLSHCSSAAADSTEECHSDDPDRGSASRRQCIRKRGIPWTEEEHRNFLIGLQKLGKGDWRGISKSYVPSRTPSQVASHAQKYFIRKSNNANRKKKRSSLFDMVPDIEANSSRREPLGMPSLKAGSMNDKFMVSSAQEANMNKSFPPLDLSLKPAFVSLPYPRQPVNVPSLKDNESRASHQQFPWSVPVAPEPIKELSGISQLTLQERNAVKIEPPALSLGLPGNP